MGHINIFFSLLICLSIIKFSETVSRFPLLLVVSFDGFRYDYLDKVPTPHFKKLIDEGVTTRWMKNVFITKTFPNHFSIVTGFYEESHGITANEMFDTEHNETFTLDSVDPKWWDNGRVLPVWIANQMENPHRFSGGMMWPGTNVLFHNQTASVYMAYNNSIAWENRVDIVMSWLSRETHPVNCIFLYFEEPDSTGHKYGPDSEEVKLQISHADNITGYLVGKLQNLNLLNKINLIILSDHGMSSVPVTHLIEMDNIVNPSLYNKYGSSPVWNVLPKQGYEDQVYAELLKGSKHHNFVLYKKEDIPDEYYYKHGHWVLPLLVVANEGWGLVHRKPIKITSSIMGQHGYNNSLYSMQPFFIAHGPSFKENYISSPFMNIDLYPLMCHLLQIGPYQSNGSLIRVQQILKVNTGGLVFTSPWITGVICIIVLTLAGITTVLIICFVRRRKRRIMSAYQIPVTSSVVRMEKSKSSPEEQHLLITSDAEET